MGLSDDQIRNLAGRASELGKADATASKPSYTKAALMSLPGALFEAGKSILGSGVDYVRQELGKQVEMTPFERFKYNLMAGPKAIKGAYDFVFQPITRRAVQYGISNEFNPLLYQKSGELDPKKLGSAGTFLLGEEPIQSVQKQLSERSRSIQEQGGTQLEQAVYPFAGLALGTVLDFSIGAGGAKKKAEKEILENIEKRIGRTLEKEAAERIEKDVAELTAKKIFRTAERDAQNQMLNDIFKNALTREMAQDIGTATGRELDEAAMARLGSFVDNLAGASDEKVEAQVIKNLYADAKKTGQIAETPGTTSVMKATAETSEEALERAFTKKAATYKSSDAFASSMAKEGSEFWVKQESALQKTKEAVDTAATDWEKSQEKLLLEELKEGNTKAVVASTEKVADEFAQAAKKMGFAVKKVRGRTSAAANEELLSRLQKAAKGSAEYANLTGVFRGPAKSLEEVYQAARKTVRPSAIKSLGQKIGALKTKLKAAVEKRKIIRSFQAKEITRENLQKALRQRATALPPAVREKLLSKTAVANLKTGKQLGKLIDEIDRKLLEKAPKTPQEAKQLGKEMGKYLQKSKDKISRDKLVRAFKRKEITRKNLRKALRERAKALPVRMREKLLSQERVANIRTGKQLGKLLDEVDGKVSRYLEAKKIARAKGVLRSKIAYLKKQKELPTNVITALKKKYGITEIKNASIEQLEKMAEDMALLRKGDRVFSGAKARAVGVPEWTTLREFRQKFLGDTKTWKSPKGAIFNYMRTLDREIEMTAGKDADRVKALLTKPRKEAVTNMTREYTDLVGQLKKTVDKYALKNKKNRRLLMQYGEGRLTLEELKKKTGDWEKLVEANDWFRGKYDQLLTDVNGVLVEYGRKEIPRRKDYYTHFQEVGDLWKAMMAKDEIDPLLTGISAATQPNARFNPFALKRKGGKKFEEDAVKAFQVYLYPTLNQKHMTKIITAHNAVVQAVEDFASQTNKRDINLFLQSLKAHSQNLAGKTNPADRFIQDFVLGRKFTKVLSWTSNKLAKNRIIGSIPSAIMQTAAIPQAVAANGRINQALGFLEQGLRGIYKTKSDPILQSKFLLRRYADVEPVIKTLTEKGQKIASVPFELIEQNTTKGIWRGAYQKFYRNGYRGEKLIEKADDLTEELVGGRALGEKPLAFESRLLSLPLQFQLEVNTLTQWIAKNILRKPADKKILGRSRNAVNLAINLYLMNELYEASIGRRPLPDPIEAVKDMNDLETWQEKSGRAIGEGLSSVAGGQFIASVFFDEQQRRKWFGRTEVGIYPGGIPIASAIQGAAAKPTNIIYDFVMPFGGGQAKRLVEAYQGINEGASFTPTGRLQFEMKPEDFFRAAIFGKWTLPQATKYLDEARDGEAETFLREIKDLPTVEQNKAIMKVRREDKRMYAELQKLKKFEKMGITKKEKAFLNLGVEDGERARMVLKYINKSDDPQATMNKLRRAGIITEDVQKQILILKKSGK